MESENPDINRDESSETRTTSLGSSLVERCPEEAGVVSSILTRGTIGPFILTAYVCKKIFCPLQPSG